MNKRNTEHGNEKEREKGKGKKKWLPTSTSVPPARIMRTARNQVMSSSKVVTKTLHFFETGKSVAKFTLGTLEVKT